jgi:hypothetical protein
MPVWRRLGKVTGKYLTSKMLLILICNFGKIMTGLQIALESSVAFIYQREHYNRKCSI